MAPSTLVLPDPGAGSYEPDPRGLCTAREAVASYYAGRGTPISPDDVVLTSGTSESYAHLFRLLADPGDVVLAPSPSYPLVEPIAAVEGVGVVDYRLTWDGAWHLDLGSVEAALAEAGDRARALIVVEPNHPTGSWLAGDERAALERMLERRGLPLLSDEVFADFPWQPNDRAAGGMLGERRVPTFVLGGLSKSCGLPQLKLGWIVAAGPEPERRRLLEGLEWISDLFLSVATPVQRALPALLDQRREYQARVRERLAANRATLERLARRRPEVSPMPGRGGWAMVARLPASRGEEWWRRLLERDVVVHPAHFYDLPLDSAVVVSLIPDVEVMREATERAGELMAAG